MSDLVSKLLGWRSSDAVPPATGVDTQIPAAATAHNPDNLLAGMGFRYPMRSYQKEILELVGVKLERGERRVHIVAPPGAGKTIIGLQLACLLQEPTLIISPTTTIQAQWAEKLDLFLPAGATIDRESIIGTHEDRPLKPITLLTYQVLSTPARGEEYIQNLARAQWVEELVAAGSTKGDAEVRILEILANNKKAHDKELGRHVTRLRKKLTEVLDLNEVLHPNALDLVQALRRQRFKVVIFDECHHLTDYWAAIMLKIIKRMMDPVVVGLTGTPPEGKSEGQANRYLSLVGEIDYQVPTPVLVREGGLAPFQDLVLFTSPTMEEESFLADQHSDFHELIKRLTEGDSSLLSDWVAKRICKGLDEGWSELAARDARLAGALCRYAWTYRLDLSQTNGGPPRRISQKLALSFHEMQAPNLEDWLELFEHFALNYLKVSSKNSDHALYDRIRAALSKLGYGLTERGVRKQASPVDRVLAFSKNKARAVAEILEVEQNSLKERLRAVVVTDFERMSATNNNTPEILSEETGGAIAVLEELLRTEVSAAVNPCMVTGSLIYVDKRIAEEFVTAMNEIFDQEQSGVKAYLAASNRDSSFVEVTSGSSGWESRLYVGVATRILERGITKVLIGTRGIFGEGWDCQALNTLVDLTTTTTPMSVKQLRGRSIRINTSDPLGATKVANNWDVVCIAPHLEKGLNDYERFARKHRGFFGICDDGQIECGVSHVHSSFNELTPVEVFASADDLNKEMKLRALDRNIIYQRWKVGESYRNKTLGCLEIGRLRKPNLPLPNLRFDLSYSEHANMLHANLRGVWLEYALLGCSGTVISCAILFFVNQLFMPMALLPAILAVWAGHKKYRHLYSQLQAKVCQNPTEEHTLRNLSQAVLASLTHTKLPTKRKNQKPITSLTYSAIKERISISQRSDGSWRLFLDGATEELAQQFIKSMNEMFSPIDDQEYLIPKYEFSLHEHEQGDCSLTPDERFFRAYLRGQVQPNLVAYYPVPAIFTRSERGRELFTQCWNKYVSPGDMVSTQEKPELLKRYFGLATQISQRLLWE